MTLSHCALLLNPLKVCLSPLSYANQWSLIILQGWVCGGGQSQGRDPLLGGAEPGPGRGRGHGYRSKLLFWTELLKAKKNLIETICQNHSNTEMKVRDSIIVLWFYFYFFQHSLSLYLSIYLGAEVKKKFKTHIDTVALNYPKKEG